MILPGPLDRRGFLGRCLGAAGAGLLAPSVLLQGVLAPRSARAAAGGRHLVLVRLFGGNDGLNTVIPWTSGLYHDARPTLAVPESLVLDLDGTVGLHPALAPLLPEYAAGRMAVIQSVHYPQGDLSHFQSEAIWATADPTLQTPTGWIGRYLDGLAPPGDGEVRGVDVSWALDRVFATDHAHAFALPRLEGLSFPADDRRPGEAAAARAAFEAAHGGGRAPGSLAARLAEGGLALSRNLDLFAAIPDGTTAAFPGTDIGAALRTVARMMAAADAGDAATGVYQVGLGGFDTHANQETEGRTHSILWADLADALAAFRAEVAARGLGPDTVVVVYSEFGRRVEENGSLGTDHGTAAPMLVLGEPVIGGLHGPPPDLADLDGNGNLKHALDFRSVYATLLGRWLGADPEAILGGPFAPVPFLPA